MTETQETYHTLRTTRVEASSRLQALEARASTALLSDEEEHEAVVLRSRIAHIEPLMASAESAMQKETDTLDIAAVVEAWSTLVDQKTTAYENFAAAVSTLKACHGQLLALHRQQERAIEQLPRQIQERLMFPDPATFAQRLAGAMRNPQGWTSVLCTPTDVEAPRVAELTANDQGTKALAPRVLERFLAGRP